MMAVPLNLPPVDPVLAEWYDGSGDKFLADNPFDLEAWLLVRALEEDRWELQADSHTEALAHRCSAATYRQVWQKLRSLARA